MRSGLSIYLWDQATSPAWHIGQKSCQSNSRLRPTRVNLNLAKFLILGGFLKNERLLFIGLYQNWLRESLYICVGGWFMRVFLINFITRIDLCYRRVGLVLWWKALILVGGALTYFHSEFGWLKVWHMSRYILTAWLE